MNITDLMALQMSNAAPFNHRDYTVWLHNQIVGRIRWELEQKAGQTKDPANVLACLNLPSLKLIEK